MYIKLAWRNIWRNTRRTSVIMAAVIIGVWSMVFLGALMRGMMVDMLENGISTLTGDLQIHHKGYRDDPSIENSMDDSWVLSRLQKYLPPGAVWASRVRVNAVASNARHSSGVAIITAAMMTPVLLVFLQMFLQASLKYIHVSSICHMYGSNHLNMGHGFNGAQSSNLQCRIQGSRDCY